MDGTRGVDDGRALASLIPTELQGRGYNYYWHKFQGEIIMPSTLSLRNLAMSLRTATAITEDILALLPAREIRENVKKLQGAILAARRDRRISLCER